MENDTATGGESLSIEQAAAAFAKARTKEVPTDHSEAEADAEGETTDDELQASDEGVSEDADGETESEEDTPEAEESESESEQGRFVANDGRVRLDDGTITTVHELKRGFLRESDYTRKRQEDAALSKETATERERITAKEKQLEEQSKYVTELLHSVIPPMPDASMLQSDPMGYMQQKAAHEQWVAHIQYLDSQRAESERQRKDKATEESKGRVAKEWQLALEKMPELKDQKKVEVFGNDILKFGPTYGFSREELATVPNDHRFMLVLNKAIAWDKLQQSKSTVQKKIEGRPPVQKGGKRLSPDAHRARAATDAMNRLKEEGTVEAAAAAYRASRKG